MIRWMESNGYTIDYICQDDLHRRPGILDAYRCLIKAGHDEYWTKEEFDKGGYELTSTFCDPQTDDLLTTAIGKLLA